MGKSKHTWNDVFQPVVACLGCPIEGNPSQFVLERLASQLLPEWRFVTLPVAPSDFAAALSGVRVMNFAGVVVLPPHETNAAAACDELTAVAQATNSVRVIRRVDGMLKGHDTFWSTLEAHLICSDTGEPRKWLHLCTNFPAETIGRLNRSLGEAQITLDDLEKTESLSIVLVDAQDYPRVPKRLTRNPLKSGSQIILLKEHPDNQAWINFAESLGLELVRPIDLLIAHYVEVFWFLTSCKAPDVFIRDALEEYWIL